jgi:DNA-binding GntR family transcriptional regulator
VKTIAQLWDGGTKFQAVFHFAPHHMSRSCAEHRQLIALLRSEDAAGAAELTRKHKLAVGRALVDFLTVTGI